MCFKLVYVQSGGRLQDNLRVFRKSVTKQLILRKRARTVSMTDCATVLHGCN